MSVDASNWVWTRSTARGTARMVLLAIADKIHDARCVAYAGTTMLVQRTNSSRSSVRRAVDALLNSGELVVVEGATGPRGETVYRLPHAVGHVRDNPSGRPVERDQAESPVANTGPGSQSPPGSTTTPGEDRIEPGRGPILNSGEGSASAPQGFTSTPHNSSSLLQEQQQPRANSPAVAKQLRPLADALDVAGVRVRWTLRPGEQREIWQLVQRHGVEQLVDLANRRTAPGDAPKSARYWLRVWGDLDHAPTVGPPTAANGNVVPLRGRTTSHTDSLLAGLALLEQEYLGQ